MLSLDRRRALGLYLWIAVAAALLLQLNSISYLLRDAEGDALMGFFLSSSLGYVAPVMPLLAALPFGTGFCADWQSVFVPEVVLRSGKRRYLFSKTLTAFLSGGLMQSLGMLSFILFLNLKFPPDFSVEPFLGDISGLETLLLGGGAGAYLSYYGARLLLAFFAGGFWAMTALTFSAFYPNLSLTLVVPLVTHRLLQELGYAVAMPAFLNVTLLEAGAVGLSPEMTLAAGAGVFLALTATLALVFCWRARRRLRYA